MSEPDITMPKEALAEAEKVIAEYRYSKRSDAAIAYAACRAMLRSWPGMRHDQRTFLNETRTGTETRIILPITEKNNADI